MTSKVDFAYPNIGVPHSDTKVNSAPHPDVQNSRVKIKDAVITSMENLTDDTYRLRVKLNAGEVLNSSAGQYGTLKVKELEKSGKINVFIKFQLNKANGSNQLESIDIKHDDGEIKNLKTDYLLGFFGLIMQLGPIANWGLNIDKKTIQVDTEKFETNQKGIYAIGDICTYPGKLKLILSGFHEGALAARACFKLARPNEKYRFEFTTTSSNLLKRLGKKE